MIASISTLHRFDALGRTQSVIEIGHSIRSPLTGAGNLVYCGLDYASGGRFAQIDLTKQYNNTVWEFITSAGISAAPVLFQAIVYVGGATATCVA